MNEIWLPCPGFEGVYSVSSLGRVRSELTRNATKAGRILSPGLKSTGYLGVTLVAADGTRVDAAVHRLVARAFHGEPVGESNVVNHIDSNRQNNIATNLEWGTHSHNLLHSLAAGSARVGAKHYKARAVYRIGHDGSATFFATQRLAADGTPGSHQGKISLVCAGVRGSHAGYRWRFADPDACLRPFDPESAPDPQAEDVGSTKPVDVTA